MDYSIELLKQAQSEVWAILPSALQALLAGKPTQANTESQTMSRPGPKSGRLARIPIVGPIRKRQSFWDLFFGGGGATIERITAMLHEAGADETVGTVMLDIDSPGGTADGLFELAAEVRKLAQSKNVIAYANGMMASAAYWLGSQADEIIAPPDALIGSVGVFAEHMDLSKMLEEMGMKITYIYEGKYKVEGNDTEPLSPEAKEHMQGLVKEVYDLFVADVAKGRGVTVATVRASYGQGRVLTAKDAKAAGMIDRIAGFDETIRRLSGMKAKTESVTLQASDPVITELEAAQENGSVQAGIVAAVEVIEPLSTEGEDTMSAEELKALNDSVVALTEQIKPLAALPAKVEAIETIIQKAPAVSNLAASISVTSDPADRPFRSIAENCAAIKVYTTSLGRNVHPRLTHPLFAAALGGSEGISDAGGFLLEPTITAEILKPLHTTGAFTSRGVRRLPVGGNSNSGWINGVDETSRATGSRWGGIRGYRRAEAATMLTSAPKFRRINWELKEYYAAVYGTDQLLQDTTQFAEVVRVGVGEELDFMCNDDILNGTGADGCTGILTSPALVSFARASASHVVYEDIVAMWQRVLPRSKVSPSLAWFINSEVSPELDTLALAAGTAAIPPRFVDYGADGVLRMKGKPVYETEFNAALGTLGDIMLIDLAEYLLWQKGDVQSAESIHVEFLTAQTVFRFIMRCDGKPTLANSVLPYKGTNRQSFAVAMS